MANKFSHMSKWLLISGGALMVAGFIFAFASATTGGGNALAGSLQASPTARPATPAPAAATPVRTATPAAPAATVRPASPVASARAGSPVAPASNPANGDSVTFPALAIALAGAGLVGLGLFARNAMGKSKA